jgi:hypothetical protein
VGRSYGVAQNNTDQFSDSDGDSDSNSDDDSVSGGVGRPEPDTKRSDEISLDLVIAAFENTHLDDRVSKTRMKNQYYLLERWVAAFESSDWMSMSMVCKEFVHTAENLGQRIIEDRVAMGDLRCFLPKNMGGIAGGKKFIEKGILIKFAGKSQVAS